MTDVSHPDRIAELRTLVDGAPGASVDERTFERLVAVRRELWTLEDQLARRLEAREIEPEQFLERTHRLMTSMMVASRDVLGSDFDRIFGEAGYEAEGLIDPTSFIEQQRSL